MQAVTLGVTNLNNIGMSVAPPGNPAAMDPAQLEQLMQLLGHKPAAAPAAMGPPKQTAVVECPKSMVGRVIGKGGETIKSLQQYTGAMIQIDQSTDPTRVTIAGSPQSLQLAVSMVSDIVRGTFKGFAMLRQIAVATGPQGVLSGFGQPQPVYVQGYGFVPPSQVFNPEDPMSASLMQGAAPTGPLTPPITPLRTTAANNLAGGLPPDTLAALLGSQAAAQPQMMQQASNNPQQEALIRHLLSQLAMQQGGAPTFPQHVSMEHSGMTGLDQGNIQSMLAQAGLMGAGQAAAAANATPGIAQVLPPSSTPNLPPSTSLMLSAQGTPAVLGSGVQSALGNFTASRADSASMPAISASPPTSFGRSSPPMHTGSYDGSGRSSPAFPGLASANPTLSTRQGPNSGTGSPLGTFGAIGSSHIGAAAEEALVAHLGHALQPSALGERGHGSQ